MPKRPDWLPKYVIVHRGWYKYRPYLGTNEAGKSIRGKEVSICPSDCAPAQFFKEWEKLTKNKSPRNLRWLFNEYLTSDRIKSKKVSLQKKYNAQAENFCSKKFRLQNGKEIILGEQELVSLTRPKIQKIIDIDKSHVQINRDIQIAKSAWNWAINRFENLPQNPFAGVELKKETPRERYIEDWEYWLVYLCADSLRVPIFAPAMELSYLCRARRDEVFSFSDSNKTEAGIYLKRSKGSRAEITEYSERLNAALTYCQRLYPDAPHPIKGRTLIHDRHGLKYTKNALDSAWRRVIAKAMDQGIEMPQAWVKEAQKRGARTAGNRVYLSEKFTFHDIKAKGVTDHEEDNAALHRSKKMEAVYNRKPKLMRATR